MKTFFLCVLVALSIIPPLAAANSPESIAIMNFANRSNDTKLQWLSKGMADMLITDLSKSNKLRIVDRQKLQAYLAEANLSSTAFIEQETALKLGRLTKVKNALYGSYIVKGNTIEIEAHIINIASQQVRRVEWVKGNIGDILNLEKELAFKIINNLHLKITNAELESIKYKATDSVDAASRFYKALDHYDNGKYLDASLELKLSIKKDKQYNKPRFLIGHVYENLGQYQHAILAFTKMAELLPYDDQADDALFYAASIAYQNTREYEKALNILDLIIARYPDGALPGHTKLNTPDGLSEVIYTHRALPLKTYMHHYKHNIYTTMGDYKNALIQYEKAYLSEDAFATYNSNEYNNSVTSRPNFKHNSTIAMRTLVRNAYRRAGVVHVPKKGLSIIEFDANKPVYSEDYSTNKRETEMFQSSIDHDITEVTVRRYDRNTQSYHIYSRNMEDAGRKNWFPTRDAYMFSAPEGYYVESVIVSINGYQTKSGLISANLNLSKMQAKGIGEFNEQGTLIPPFGSRQFLFELRFNETSSKEKARINNWNIKANLKPLTDYGSIEIDDQITLTGLANKEGTWTTFDYWECPCKITHVPVGQYTVHSKVGTKDLLQQVNVIKGNSTKASFTSQTKTSSTKVFEPSIYEESITSGLPGWKNHIQIFKGKSGFFMTRNLKMLLDSNEVYRVFWSEQLDQNGRIFSDIQYVESSDGLNWSTPKKLPSPISTNQLEAEFDIIQGEDGKFYIAFYAERANKQGFFISSSENLVNWTNPRMIVENTAKLKGKGRIGIGSISNMSLSQRHDGLFQAYYTEKFRNEKGGATRGLNHMTSNNFFTWSKPSRLRNHLGGKTIEDKTGTLWKAFSTRISIQALNKKLLAANIPHKIDAPPNHSRTIIEVSSSVNGIDWSPATLVQPSITAPELSNNSPHLIANNKGGLTLAWNRTSRIAFSQSSDGKNWSPSGAEVTMSFKKEYPNGSFDIMQKPDNEYIMVFANHYGLWVSHSKNPFH